MSENDLLASWVGSRPRVVAAAVQRCLLELAVGSPAPAAALAAGSLAPAAALAAGSLAPAAALAAGSPVPAAALRRASVASPPVLAFPAACTYLRGAFPFRVNPLPFLHRQHCYQQEVKGEAHPPPPPLVDTQVASPRLSHRDAPPLSGEHPLDNPRR